MMARRLSPRALGAFLCAALAMWLSAGALTITSAAHGAVRIGLLPSLWWLFAGFVAAFVLALVARLDRQNLTVLLITVVLIVPWLPVPIPHAALVWAGPLRFWVWAAIAVALGGPTVARSRVFRVSRVLSEPRRAPIAAAVIAATVYLAAAWSISPRLPAGDEPHYLIIAQSLLRDRDLQIENNHNDGDYRSYFPGVLRPDYLQRGINGQIYSVHAPGLPAVVAPVFAVFGYPGVLAFLGTLSGIGTGIAWCAAWRVTRDVAASWFGWAAVALSVPFVFQAFTVFPDGLGATLVMVGALAVVINRDLSLPGLVVTGVAVAVLPWLHTRFAVTALALSLVLARQLGGGDRARRLVAFSLPPALSAIGWFAFFYAIYGTPNPAAPYGGNTQSSILNVLRGLTGLLFDQQFGLVPNAPATLCALLGFITLARQRSRLAVDLGLVIVPYVLATSAFYMWWGGFSSPARFLVSILLPLAIPAAVWYASRPLAMRVLGLSALLLSVVMTASIVIVERGALLYNTRDSPSKFLLWLSPLVNLTTALPSLFQTDVAGALERAAVWSIVVGVTAAAATVAGRRSTSVHTIALTGALTAAVAATAALSTVWWRSDSHPVMEAKAGALMLRAVNPDASQIAIRFAPLHGMPVADLLPMVPLTEGIVSGGAQQPIAVVTRPPAGRYAVEATIVGNAHRLTAGIDRIPGPLWTWDLTSVRGRWRETIVLPVATQAIRVDGDAATRAALSDLTIRAERVFASSERATDRDAFRAARYGPATLFFLGGSAFIEPGGTWVAGERSADFAIVPDSRGPVHVLFRNAAVDNVVTLEAEGFQQSLSFKAREERVIDLTEQRRRLGTVLRVSSARGARPSDVEPGNQDRRLLGCWIEVR